MNDLEIKLNNLIDEGVRGRLFPACAISALTPAGELTAFRGSFTYEDNRSVRPDSIFDVASITKVIPTSSLALKLIEDGRLGLHDDIRRHLPEYLSKGDKVTIWNLLTHTVYYEFGHRLSSISHRPPDEILKAIYAAPAKTSTSEVTYTNSSSILLGLIVEKLYGADLEEAGRREFFDPLGMTRTSFIPRHIAPDHDIVPTEIHQRRGLVHGDVHDESAFGLQPQRTGTAGLFSTAPDLLKFLKMLVYGGEIDGRKFLSPDTIAQIGHNQLDGADSTGLGWELDQPRYMGRYSKGMFGKTGFTGCLVLGSPTRQSAVAILTNHIYPNRPKDFEAINRFRQSVADAVFGSAEPRGVQ